MSKKKYHLSPQSVQELTERLMKAAHEPDTLHENITEEFMSKVVKVTSIHEVIEREEQLNKTYQGLLSLYGFDSIYDMYLYAIASSQLESIVKRKDYSKLVPVKRKVMRNGKETEVTVYEDPNKDNKEDTDSSDSGSQGSRGGHARDHSKKVHGKDKKVDPQKVAKLKQISLDMPNGKNFRDQSDYFLEVTDEQGNTVGIVGYSSKGNYLVMDFYVSDGEVSGVAAVGFSILVRLAISEKKGVKAENNPEAAAFYARCGLQQKGEYWEATAQELKNFYGDTDFHVDF
ncbi:virion structural protein [Bacillus phage Bobb]|uniref:Uncharacterized protein n=1 Tax=Bacillus phage Bobb TaxID=1527469 RepID=A0A076G7L6_9CAUD|nr:virion structural protein [Bacillus phage Bobb]AII28116.1 hypothetical protein [Bacillus phage Bobb]